MVLTVEDAGLGLDLPVRVARRRRIQRLRHELIDLTNAQMNCKHTAIAIHNELRHTPSLNVLHLPATLVVIVGSRRTS